MDSKIETYDDLEREMIKQPLQIYSEELELFKNAYNRGLVSEPMLRNALDRNEITLKEYVKILNK